MGRSPEPLGAFRGYLGAILGNLGKSWSDSAAFKAGWKSSKARLEQFWEASRSPGRPRGQSWGPRTLSAGICLQGGLEVIWGFCGETLGGLREPGAPVGQSWEGPRAPSAGVLGAVINLSGAFGAPPGALEGLKARWTRNGEILKNLRFSFGV